MLKEGAPKEIRLADYEAPDYTTTDVDLTFDIHPGRTRVTSVLQIQRLREGASSFSLDGQALELISVAVDGQELTANEYQVDDESLTLLGLDNAHEVTIVTEIEPESNTALEGLYRSSSMYCTQ